MNFYFCRKKMRKIQKTHRKAVFIWPAGLYDSPDFGFWKMHCQSTGGVAEWRNLWLNRFLGFALNDIEKDCGRLRRMTNFRLKTETGHSVQVIKAKTPLIDFFWGQNILAVKEGSSFAWFWQTEILALYLANNIFYIKLKELFLWRKS